MKGFLNGLVVSILLVACGSVAFQDPNVLVMDLPNGTLRAHDPKNDRKSGDCDPHYLPSGKVEYQCVAHFLTDYQLLLTKIADLENQLSACQRGR